MSVTVYYGPMFAGKTTKLINRIQTKIKERSVEQVIVFKHSMDDRYNNDNNDNREYIVSHDREKYIATPVDKLMDYAINVDKKYYFIDEGHFFDDLVEFCLELKENGKHVYVAGLDKVFDGSSFTEMKKLIECADWAFYIQGQCNSTGCTNKSEYSYLNTYLNTYLNNAPEKVQIIVGGAEKYEPLCGECFKLKTKN